ncbi:MAG: hypothetical protein EOO68_33030 [Moraxellaceae bacterium]|nr:MAG: hypothetical protein EOO68_33030 [Moraxellaceae bacterium]
MPIRPVYFSFFLSAFLLFLATGFSPVLAQEEEEEYTGEFILGLNLNSNGGLLGGVMAKRSKIYNEKTSHFLQLEIVEVKHPKEWRYINEETQSVFVLGKSNYLFVIRPQVGFERNLFRKASDQGIHVNFIGAAGPSLGILKPYLIYYDYSNGLGNDVRIEQYDPMLHNKPNNILGNAGFATNFSDSKIEPGFAIRAGLSFEYSQFRDKVAGIEVGLMYEQFLNKLNIMPEARKSSSYQSAYMTIYIGWRK